MNPNHIEKTSDSSVLIDYTKIREFHSVKCGIEFRDLELPEMLKN